MFLKTMTLLTQSKIVFKILYIYLFAAALKK
jgi:hypothetical protein